MNKPSKYKLITWRDSASWPSQEDFRCENFNVYQIESIGWELLNEKDRIVLVHEWIDENTTRGVISIPRENIISDIELKMVETKI